MVRTVSTAGCTAVARSYVTKDPAETLTWPTVPRPPIGSPRHPLGDAQIQGAGPPNALRSPTSVPRPLRRPDPDRSVQAGQRDQKVAMGFTAEPVAPGIASGAHVKRNSLTPSAAHMSRKMVTSG